MTLLDAVRDVAEAVLRRQAERVDVDGVPRSHIDALADLGLLGLVAPSEHGGIDATLPVQREVTEVLAAADATTWFVWTQHHTPVRTLLRATNTELRDRLLPELTRDKLAGVAFTHLRRPGPPSVEAVRTSSGWTVQGELAWLTSYGIADVFCVAAQHGDDVVWLYTPLRGVPGVSVSDLALAAMTGTATVRVGLDGLEVADEDVALVEPLADWRIADAARTADVSPAVLGVTADAVRRLRERNDAAADAAADRFAEELERLRPEAYRLADADPGQSRDRRLQLRAAAHALAVRATAALVAAGAGRSMLLDAPAQRLARTALFLMVQGQTRDVRDATLRSLGT